MEKNKVIKVEIHANFLCLEKKRVDLAGLRILFTVLSTSSTTFTRYYVEKIASRTDYLVKAAKFSIVTFLCMAALIAAAIKWAMSFI